MKSRVVAMVVPGEGLEATLVVRRADGQFALESIDPRVAAALRVAAAWSGTPTATPEYAST